MPQTSAMGPKRGGKYIIATLETSFWSWLVDDRYLGDSL